MAKNAENPRLALGCTSGRRQRSDMNQAALPMVYHVRYGDTAWTLTAQHTGRTDLPLNVQGERQARELGANLTALRIDRIRSSPLQRARRTVELALS